MSVQSKVIPESNRLLRAYQQKTFASMLLGVGIACFWISIAYFVSYLIISKLPNLALSLAFMVMALLCGLCYWLNYTNQYMSAIRIFLVFANLLVGIVYLFNPPQLLLIGAVGATIIVISALYLDTEKFARLWVAATIGVLLFSAVLHHSFSIPYVELGWVAGVIEYGVPIAVFIVLAILGRHTIQQLKIALVQSEISRSELEQSNRELENFAYITSHDLQEPLRKIMAFGERLNHKSADKLNPQSLDYLKRMLNAAETYANTH